MTDSGGDPKQSDIPAWTRMHLWEIVVVRDVFWIGLVFGTLYLGYRLSSIFTPVLIGLALAYLFHPLISMCERRWKMPRPLTISIILAVSLSIMVLLAVWLVPKVIGQLGDLARNTPHYVEQVRVIAEKRGVSMGPLEQELKAWSSQVSQDPATWIGDKLKLLLAGTGQAVSVIGQIIGGTVYMLMTAVLIPVYFFCFAWQFGPLVNRFHAYLPESHRKHWLEIISRMDRTVSTYFRDRVIIAGMMVVMFCVGWAMAGVPYWFLLGLAAGLLSLIPYASGIIWPVALGLMYLNATSGEDAPGFTMMGVLVWPSVVYGVVQFVESWVLTPWIQGKSMEMGVATILIVMFVGGALGGLYGLLLCIPVAACGKILIEEVCVPRLRTWAQSH